MSEPQASWPKTTLTEGPPHVVIEAGRLEQGAGMVTYPTSLSPEEQLELVRSNWRIEVHRDNDEVEYSLGGNGHGDADSFTYAEEFELADPSSTVHHISVSNSLLGDWVLPVPAWQSRQGDWSSRWIRSPIAEP